MKLTRMQQRYIWLAGSFPQMSVRQGRGYRSRHTKFGLDADAGELVIFGYSNPLYFMERRGLFRRLQAPALYTLTEVGEAEFGKMLIKGDGGNLNQEVSEVRLKPSRLGEG